MARQCRIKKFPTPPDPATTPETKLPTKATFAASFGGVEVAAEKEYSLDAGVSDWFPIPDDAGEVSALFSYYDASNLRSGFTTQNFAVSPAVLPDTTPPDAPVADAEIEVQDVPTV